ncbi:hypothetical protein DID88_001274 [Monilinia fructigena]|uniref:Exonuclease domain-containing protein n=1 Tax=Monilinia fructigena TaxID=38457 RepID=A0A395IZD7_9HELO|nr:hypothetical protein DID88_001274 [Monilinia fructigena]
MEEVSTSHPLVWIDCEMTGLDLENDNKETMDKMDQWCTRTHASTGLTSEVLSSTTTPAEAALSLLAYIKKSIQTSYRSFTLSHLGCE